MTVNTGEPQFRFLPMLAVGAFVAFVHIAWWLIADTTVAGGGLSDGDGYARLVRVIRLIETGAWYDSSFPRANAPYGFELHWTRPLDVLLLLLAAPLTPLIGLKGALFWAGAVVSPLLHVLSAMAMVWAAMPVLGRPGAYLAGALTAAQAGLMGYAIVGHADHHLLYALMTVLAFGFIMRLLASSSRSSGYALGGGFFLALGLWVGPETLVLVVLFQIAAALAWAVDGGPIASRAARLAWGLALTLSLVLMAERGPADYITVDFDRVSMAHLTMAALLAAFWMIAGRMEGRIRRPAGRLGFAVLGVLVMAAAMWGLYPEILLGPKASIDASLLDHPQALIPLSPMIAELGSIDDPWRLLIYLGTAVFAVPWLFWRIKRQWSSETVWPWVFMALAVLVYVVLAVNWIRWSLYSGIFLAVVLGDIVACLDVMITERIKGPTGNLVKVAAVLVLVLGPAAGGLAGIRAGQEDAASKDDVSCDIQALSGFLNSPPWNERSLIILASANFGPEILYRTGHRVLATLHHRNASGIFDGWKVLGGADEGEILKMVNQRGISLIAICPGSSSDRYFLEDTNPRVLYRRLVGGDPPAWLGEVELPPALKDGVRLFRVTAKGYQ